MSATGIGAAVRRKEDHRFITGKGQYTDDINRPGETHAYFLRSPHAHARIKSDRRHGRGRDAGRGRGADRRRARRRQDRQPDLRLDDPFQGRLADEDGAASGARARQGLPCRRCGRRGRSPRRWRRRKDAAEKVEVDYEVLPAVTDPAKAQAKGAPQIHEIAPNNTIYQWHLGDRRRPRPRSSRPSTSPSSTSSTTAWCRTRSSRAPRSANTMPAPTASRSGTPRRTRTSRAS